MGKRSKFCGVIENEVALFIEKIIVRGQSTALVVASIEEKVGMVV